MYNVRLLVMWLEKDCVECKVAGVVAGGRLCTQCKVAGGRLHTM